MSVTDVDIIDLVGVDRATGDVVLTISDHLPWHSDEHLLVLQDKLNAYLRFIESGELVEQYPEARDRKPRITVVFQYPPNERGVAFLERISKAIENAGIAFRYEALPH